jgi:hypothetical protein
VNVASRLEADRATNAGGALRFHDVQVPLLTSSDPVPAAALNRSDSVPEEVEAPSSSMKRWLQT